MFIDALAATVIALSTLGASHDDRDMTPLAPPPMSQLVSTELGLDVPVVGDYTDCSGHAAVSHDGAMIDTCLVAPDGYFIGHNPGPFTPLMQAEVGSRLTYYDGTGLPHDYRVVSIRAWMARWGQPPLASADVTAQFQTCITLDGTWDRIVDVAPA